MKAAANRSSAAAFAVADEVDALEGNVLSSNTCPL